MAYDIENKTSELLIYDKVSKSINYYPKSELSVYASSGNIVITQTVGELTNSIFSQEASMIDQPSVDGFSGGWADYADVATTGTPINVTATPAVLTNDGLGVDTITTYLPVGGNGITQLWDASSNGFDFSDLNVGDMIDIRMDVTITITSTNTAVDIDLKMGTGGAISVPFISEQNFRRTGSYEVIRYMGVYIGSEDVRNNLAQLEIFASNNCTCVVHGWYIKAIRRG